MSRHCRLLLISLVFSLVACTPSARAQTQSEEQILGQWQGTGVGGATIITFNADHTLYDSWGTGATPEKGSWAFENGKFKVDLGDNGEAWPATINARGKLIFEDVSGRNGHASPDWPWVFRRLGGFSTSSPSAAPANAPASAPADPAALAAGLLGDWRYACSRNSEHGGVPTFDILHFGDAGALHTTCTLVGKPANGTYSLTGDVVNLNTTGAYPVVMDLRAQLLDNGRTLVLSPTRPDMFRYAEYEFKRPIMFPRNTLAGTWTMDDLQFQVRREMIIDETCSTTIRAESVDGRFKSETKSSLQSYCRLWPASFGTAVTFVSMEEPMLGVTSVVMKYERKGNLLVLGPVAWNAAERFEAPTAASFIRKLKQP